MADAKAADDKTAGATKPPCDATTIAFASFLRSEAEAADFRAKQLWAQADKLIQDHGLEQHFQTSPKKPGKKVKRKRSIDPARKKQKKLTGYTLFMKEVNSTVRKENPSLDAKDVVQKVAQLWNEKSEEQKLEWKSKAEAKTNEGFDKEKVSLEEKGNNEAEGNNKDQTSEVV
eukprot:scaffold7197_cov88-Skeletonema_menzelii.AAC.10